MAKSDESYHDKTQRLGAAFMKQVAKDDERKRKFLTASQRMNTNKK